MPFYQHSPWGINRLPLEVISIILRLLFDDGVGYQSGPGGILNDTSPLTCDHVFFARSIIRVNCAFNEAATKLLWSRVSIKMLSHLAYLAQMAYCNQSLWAMTKWLEISIPGPISLFEGTGKKKKTYDPIHLTPRQYTAIRSRNTGDEEEVEIVKDRETGVLLLQCPTCLTCVGYPKEKTQLYLSHRGSDPCKKAKRVLDLAQNEREVEEALQKNRVRRPTLLWCCGQWTYAVDRAGPRTGEVGLS
ncbi:hypothetical protein FA13DRAFT_1720967 [Coprinellus micaceus]|uniref:Uncharacterized protein n=1 Tax=Coprinellus micaceus TaxID=71717 RepID=A0A4Y7S411_COPMI|nr:hypothetical protein FA13DRAFT_1720967 [Coprinellus micaceus]